MSFHAVLLAGGIGSRLAPLSTPERPKQVLPLLPGGRTPLRATLERIEPLVSLDRILVVTGRPMEAAVRLAVPELPDDAFLVEPEGRNTLPALVWATAEVARRGGTGLISLHADHRIDDEVAFRRVAATAIDEAGSDEVVLVGLQPSWAHPGLGWIVPGNPVSDRAFQVSSFVEKPPPDQAQALLANGALWNLGLFCWTLRAFRREYPGSPLPFEALMAGKPVEEQYPDLEPISVDRGLVERAGKLRVVKGDFDWSDLGTWEAIGRSPPR